MNGVMLFLPPAWRIALHHSGKHCVSPPILNNSAIFSHLESLFETLQLDGLLSWLESCCFSGALLEGTGFI